MPLMTGRCLAPNLSDEKLTQFAQIIPEITDDKTNQAAALLLEIVDRHKAGYEIGMLPTALVRAEAGQLFDKLQEPQRTPAFHLLWYVNELALGRSPE